MGQGDTIFTKLFIATVQEIFKNAQLEEKGITTDGEKLSDLRFADDEALTTEGVKDMEHESNTIRKKEKIGLKIHKEKAKCMTSIDITYNIRIDRTETEKVTNYKYLGQTTAMESRTRQKVLVKIRAGWSVFGKYGETFLDRHLPMSLKRKVQPVCLTSKWHGCQTWSLTKALGKKFDTSQRAMERKMLTVKLKDRIHNGIIRQRTRVIDIAQYVTSGNGLDILPKWKTIDGLLDAQSGR